jgi:hypothetical protein
MRGGCLFTRKLSPAKLLEFENDFCVLLKQVQAWMTHIYKEIDVRDAYGLIRLSRYRGLPPTPKIWESLKSI